MDVRELRIGNYLQGKHLVQVTAIHLNHTVSISGNLSRFIVEGDEPCLKPIPLTEEWLLKLGGEKQIGGAGIFYDRFLLTWRKEYNFWYVRDLQTRCYITKVEFVHEWQNVVYALNGKELTLKD